MDHTCKACGQEMQEEKKTDKKEKSKMEPTGKAGLIDSLLKMLSEAGGDDSPSSRVDVLIAKKKKSDTPKEEE